MVKTGIIKSIPLPSERRVAIHITPASQRHIRSGHPWLFDESITKQSHAGISGDLAVIYDSKSKFLAVGIYDPFSTIRVRILQHRKPANINKEWFNKKFKEALVIRKPLLKTDTDGYRIVNGENDGLPGLIIDRYAGTLVVKIYSPAWVPYLPNIIPALLEVMPLERVVLRMNRITQTHPKVLHGLEDGQVLFGSELEGAVIFKENGIFFESDVVNGQKTGFFLDQRDNRSKVEKLAKGKDILNVFSYTGGFTLYSARGEAKSVTSVDSSKHAIACIERNIKLNSDNTSITNCSYKEVTDDAFKTMDVMRKLDKSFDIVVIDPPSFAKKESEVSAALESYSNLVKLGLGVLRKDGIIVIASCSSRVPADKFFATVLRAADSVKRRLEVIEKTGHAIDHPASFAEGTYLKCIFARG